MKIALTGHMYGIGEAIRAALIARGDEVVGMSRSNGFELPQEFDKVISTAYDCDVFINNANVGDVQVQLLYKMFELWRRQEGKHIICLSSRVGGYTSHGVDPYAVEKAKLDLACSQLFYMLDQRPMVSNVRPGTVDTPRQKHQDMPLLTPDEVAQAVLYVLDAPFYVSQITLCRQGPR